MVIYCTMRWGVITLGGWANLEVAQPGRKSVTVAASHHSHQRVGAQPLPTENCGSEWQIARCSRFVSWQVGLMQVA